jgi:hypothetical protein
MIEMRIIDNGLMCRPEFQYRHHILTTDASGGLCPPSIYEEWSDWKTAPVLKEEEIEND